MTALPDLDPVIHAAARLKVTATLAALGEGDRISFPRLQKLLEMTAGNLSTHLRKLEDAGYVLVDKTHEGRAPVTYLSLTGAGRRALEEYTAALRSLLSPDLGAGGQAMSHDSTPAVGAGAPPPSGLRPSRPTRRGTPPHPARRP